MEDEQVDQEFRQKVTEFFDQNDALLCVLTDMILDHGKKL